MGVDFVSRYVNPSEALVNGRRGWFAPNQMVVNGLRVNRVDLGAVVFRAQLLATLNARFCVHTMTTSCAFATDGQFVELIVMQPNVKSEVVHQVLFMHQ